MFLAYHPTSPSSPEREIALSGELDIAAVPALETELRDARRAGIAVSLDLSRITFIDLCAARCILNAALAAALAEQTLTIVSPSAAVDRMLTLMRAEDFITTRAAGSTTR